MFCLFRTTISGSVFYRLLQVSHSIFILFLDSGEEKMSVYFFFSKDAFDDLLEGFWRKDVEDRSLTSAPIPSSTSGLKRIWGKSTERERPGCWWSPRPMVQH